MLSTHFAALLFSWVLVAVGRDIGSCAVLCSHNLAHVLVSLPFLLSGSAPQVVLCVLGGIGRDMCLLSCVRVHTT